MNILESIENAEEVIGVIGSPSDSFETTVDILGVSSQNKLLGELVLFTTKEGDDYVVSLGQITDIKTENKWHEEPAFKAVIKRHGSLPHLSGDADNRIATLTVQSSFKVDGEEASAHKLSNSPSTGIKVKKVNNDIMSSLVKEVVKGQNIKYLGNAYDTEVEIPFWFKHFKAGDCGAGDAYHIGVFGKTGSGKTTTAARILEGYSQNSEKMSILILDPQEQFYNDNQVLPNGESFKDSVKGSGMDYKALKIPDDVYLPNDAELFVELLDSSKFIRKTFNINTEEKRELMKESIVEYLEKRIERSGLNLGSTNSSELLQEMFGRFITPNTDRGDSAGYTHYIENVYSQNHYKDRLVRNISTSLEDLREGSFRFFSLIDNVIQMFKSETYKISFDQMVRDIVNRPGNLYIINLSSKGTYRIGSDNVQAFLIKLITSKIIEIGEDLWNEGEKSNCLIVMDEAHRYTNANPSDQRLKELNKEIVDAVRTTRKYGVGYMFITQTIESMDEEIIQQMRIFAFGYGLTMGREYAKIKQIINDDRAAKFYKSFIDPSSNQKFPFMFHGPISPLSFTGSPLFIEMK